MPDQELERLLTDFVSVDCQRQHAAVRDLLANRKHHAAAADHRFDEGLQALLFAAAQSPKPSERLLALADVMRLSSAMKPLRGRLEQQLPSILKLPLPEPMMLADPDDRKYIARACAIARPQWASEYCARAVIFEEAGEHARAAFFTVLADMTSTLDAALRGLIPPMKEWRPATEAPGESVARRLRRVLAAVRKVMDDASIEPGGEPGRAIAELIRAAFTGAPQPSDLKVASETAEEVAGAVHELVRLRFSLATEPSTYEAIRIARNWRPGRLWEAFARDSPVMALLAQDLTEAICILARQGVADEALADLLSIAAGSREQARQRMAALAKRPGIHDDVKLWLVDRRNTRKVAQHEIGETATLNESIQLADLIVDAQRFRGVEATYRREMFPEMEMLQPRQARQLERLLNYALGLCDASESLGRRRGLRLRGMPGDLEDYSPMDHELIEGSLGARKVRVLRPVVEQVQEDGTPFVIRKGVVEPVSSVIEPVSSKE